jgi:Holliday junction resolvase RusA-like endonuclease
MTKEVSFMLEGEPKQWARAGRSGKFSFTPRPQAVHMDLLRLAVSRVHKGPPLDGPLKLSISCVYEWPKSWSDKRRRATGAHWKTSKPDADNLVKIVGDSLNKILWHDDAQIAETYCTKQYGLTSATYVLVTCLTVPA